MGLSRPRKKDVTEDTVTSGDWSSHVIETALDAMVTIDASGRVVRFNRAAEQIFGYSRAEAIGQPLADLIIPADLRDAHRSRLARLARGEQPIMLDHLLLQRAVRKSGEEFPVELIVTRTSEDPLLFTGFVRDLSRLVRAEDLGARLDGLLTTAEDLADMGSWELDLRSQRAFWSAGLYRIHDFAEESFEPGVESYLEVIHEEDRARVEKLLRTVVEAPERLLGRDVTIDYRVVRRDDEVRELRARGRVEADDDGAPLRWVGMAQDVTEQRMTEQGLLAHYAVTQALRDWESFDEGVVGLLRRLGTALDVPFGSLWIRDADARLTCRAFWSAPGGVATEFEAVTRERSYRRGEDLPGRAWDAEQPVIVEDVTADVDFDRRAHAAAAGVLSAVSFPAVGDSGPLAVLAFYARDRRPHREPLVRTLDGIGHELGRFLERRRADLGAGRLTKRELEVLKLAAEGNTGPRIAEQLVVGPATVKTHFEHIYEKLGVSDRAAAVAHALRIGLIH
jgi:PAS domain S-box-containing protein